MQDILKGALAAKQQAALERNGSIQLAELKALKDRLAKTLNIGAEANAMAYGAAVVAKKMVEELAAEQAGKRVGPRLSDPKNQLGRNQAFAAEVAKKLKGTPGYSGQMSPSRERDLAAAKKLK